MSRGHNVQIGQPGRRRRRRRRLSAFACGLWLGLAGCAHGAKPATAPAPGALDARLTQLEQRLAERDQLVTQLEGRLSLLEAEQRQLRYALAEREASAPMGVRETVRIGEDSPSAREERRAERAKSEPRPVLRLYENKRPSGDSFRGDLELEPIPQVSERLPVAPLPESLGLGRASAGSARADEQDPYLAAIDLVRRRDFPAALGALGAFLRDFPGDQRAGRALFWRGEVLFAQKEYKAALQSFETSIEREPRGEKAPDSLLKIGLCHKRLGAPERARTALHQLKTQFPQSNAARLAQAEEA